MKYAITTMMMLALAFAANAQEQQAKTLAGWPGVFPELIGYQRIFEKPVADKQTYQQAARYEWTGGRAETIRIVLLRDMKEAKQHTPDAIKERADAPMTIKLGERDAYLWKGRMLVIPLKDDRLVKLEALTFKLYQSNLPAFAKKLDLDACAKALEQPPRTDFTRNVDAFKSLKKGMSLDQVREWVGEADKDIGSGIHILTYPLADGSRVLIGFPDFKRLIYVKHEDKAGKVVDLAK